MIQYNSIQQTLLSYHSQIPGVVRDWKIKDEMPEGFAGLRFLASVSY